MKVTTLIVEDDNSLRTALQRSFQRRGHEVLTATRLADARKLLGERGVTLVLLDIWLPDGSGLDLLADVRAIDDEIRVIVMTAFPEVQTAVRAMREGAHDFVMKPFELEELHLAAQRAIETLELRRNVRRLEREQHSREGANELLGESGAIAQVRAQIAKVAEADTPVLIVGETGTGKEMVADAIHRSSARAAGPLVKVNCSAMSEHLLESELFGHEKGAYTDAKDARAGLFEMADGGTLFLDEISEMKSGLQAKLLRVVEGQPFRRVGGQREIQTSVRVIAATNRDLQAQIRAREFREDLYFRLNVFQISVPPLRVRGSDIVLLARAFLARSAAALRKSELRLSANAEQILMGYRWPGNVRELRNVMERAAILCESGAVDVDQLPGELQANTFLSNQVEKSGGALPKLSEIERQYMAYVLEKVNGNISEAARILGIARNTLKAGLRLTEDNNHRDTEKREL